MLRSFFSDKEIDKYCGLDISEAAAQLFRARQFQRSIFIVADFDEYQFDGQYNIIVFNEAIGYARDPSATFCKYFKRLPRDGVCVISMHDYDIRSRAAWRRIERHLKPQYTSRLINEKGQAWDIKVFEKSGY